MEGLHNAFRGMIKKINDRISKHTVGNAIELSNNTDYTTTADGYLKLSLSSGIASYAYGYVGGELMISCNNNISGSDIYGYGFNAVFVRKGTVIKAMWNNSGSARFFPLE